MNKTSLNISRSCSAVTFSAAAANRSRWFVAFVSGIAMAAICTFLLISNSLVVVRPVQAFSKQSRDAGAAVFHAKGCEHCHGLDGIGTDRGPDLSGVGKLWKKDRIEQQIRDGGGGMPPFGEALQPDEVKALVDYLGAKRKPAKAPKPQAPPVRPSSDDAG